MKSSRIAIKILEKTIKDSFQYPGRLIADTVILIGRFGVLLLIYWYVFNLNNGVIKNTTFQLVAWGMYFYFLYYTLGLKNIYKSIKLDVNSGNIEVLFSKPVSYIFYKFWWQIGLGAYSFLVISLITSILMVLVIGVPETMKTYLFIPSLIGTLFLGSFLTLLLYSIIGLLAFWMEEVNPVYWIVDKSVMILGGSYLPVALFPEKVLQASTLSPFGATNFITRIIYDSWESNWYQLLGLQAVWIFILGIVVGFMFNGAKRKLSVNGG